MPSKIVVRFKNDKIIKGTVQEFYVNKDTFHLHEDKTNKGHVVEMAKVKAVFFVKSFEGDKNRKKKPGFIQESQGATKAVVKFFDGEIIYGYTQDYNPYTKGFFLFPADPDSNSTNVFIPLTSILEIKLGDEIDKSVYANTSPKFLKPIAPKSFTVKISVSVGQYQLPSGKIKVAETGEAKDIKQNEPVTFNLRPGNYNLEIIYENYSIKRSISVSKDETSFKIDLQN